MSRCKVRIAFCLCHGDWSLSYRNYVLLSMRHMYYSLGGGTLFLNFMGNWYWHICHRAYGHCTNWCWSAGLLKGATIALKSFS